MPTTWDISFHSPVIHKNIKLVRLLPKSELLLWRPLNCLHLCHLVTMDYGQGSPWVSISFFMNSLWAIVRIT